MCTELLRSGTAPAPWGVTTLALALLSLLCTSVAIEPGQAERRADRPADFEPRWACVPWGARHVQDNNWPLLVDAYRSHYPEFGGQVVVHLNGDYHAWAQDANYNESTWAYSATVDGHEQAVECKPVFVSVRQPGELQFHIGCRLPFGVNRFHFMVHTHDPIWGSHTYENVTICPPPLPVRYKLVMNTWVRPNRIDRFWLMPWIKAHQALGAEAVVVYIILEFGDQEMGQTWDQIFDQQRMQSVLDLFSDLKNVVFVPFTMSTRRMKRPPHWHAPYNQHGMAAHLLYTLKGLADWVGMVDVDEYFFPAGNTTSLLQIIDKYQGTEYAGLAGSWESYAGAGWTPEQGNVALKRPDMNVTGSVLDCTSKGRQSIDERWPKGNGLWDPPTAFKQLVRPERTKMFKIHTFQHSEPFHFLDQQTEASVRHFQHQCECFLPPCDVVDTSGRDLGLALGITPCAISHKHPACVGAAQNAGMHRSQKRGSATQVDQNALDSANRLRRLLNRP